MKNVRAQLGFWLLGSSLALAGVLVARGLAPQLAGSARVWCALAGQLGALGGLLVLAIGVSRRLRAGRREI